MSTTRRSSLPLTSNSEILTELVHDLGAPCLSFHDVLSLTETDLLASIPRPALALVLVYPEIEVYQQKIASEEATRVPYDKSEAEDLLWFEQTASNACGFQAVLHALCNGKARQYIGNKTPRRK